MSEPIMSVQLEDLDSLYRRKARQIHPDTVVRKGKHQSETDADYEKRIKKAQEEFITLQHHVLVIRHHINTRRKRPSGFADFVEELIEEFRQKRSTKRLNENRLKDIDRD